MTRLIRKIPMLICIALMPLLSCCCLDGLNHNVKYVVDGVASGVSVRFHNEFGDEIFWPNIALPWIKEFDIEFRDAEYYGGSYQGDIFPAYLEANITRDGFGKVWVAIYVDGKLVSTDTTSGANMTAIARYGIRL